MLAGVRSQETEHILNEPVLQLVATPLLWECLYMIQVMCNNGGLNTKLHCHFTISKFQDRF